MYKLAAVEAFRAQVLLEESLKKLQFLTSISNNASVHGDELTQHMGDEISRIIQEQRDLERRYEELISSRGQLKGLCNKSKFMGVQQQIQDVAHKLKESNKSLCRNLKENPNVQGNLLKMQQERALVQEYLEETKTDLVEMSYANLIQKVETERRDQELLSEVKRKAQEASQTVKELEANLQREYAEHQKETNSANLEIKELKDELQKNKTISSIELAFEEKKLRAQESARLRLFAQEEKTLQENVRQLEEAKLLENTVHERAHDFLQVRLDSLQEQRQDWQNRYDGETKEREEELNALRERRGRGFEELTLLQERLTQEVGEQRAKEEEMHNAVLVERQRRDQLKRMQDAVLLLQSEGRAYMERLALRNANKKGKKGKKGKKKK